MRIKSQSLLPGFNSSTASISHGGSLARGKRKTYRPIDPRQALHVVLRASGARGERSMLRRKHERHVHDLIHARADRWGVRIYRFANVGNHLHLLVKVPSRPAWQRFLKEISGEIAILITGARKGQALKKNESGRGFWDDLAFTRIVKLGRDFDGVARYLVKNLFEAAGVPMKKLLARGYRIMSMRDAPD